MKHKLQKNLPFLEYLGIEHKKGVPHWPQRNGQVERCNETILKVVGIARLEGRDWWREVEEACQTCPTLYRAVQLSRALSAPGNRPPGKMNL